MIISNKQILYHSALGAGGLEFKSHHPTNYKTFSVSLKAFLFIANSGQSEQVIPV